MKRALLVLALAAGTASAEPLLTGPAGWKGQADPELVTATGGMPHFAAGVHGVVEAERYDAPAPGVVLYATRVTANSSERDAGARAELDALHATRQGAIEQEPWREHVDPAHHTVEATIAWRDPSTHVRGRSRIVVAASADRIAAVTGECMAGDDAAPAAIDACAAALATLDPGIAADQRVAFAPAVAGSVLAPPPPASPPVPQSSMSDASKTPMPPIVVPHDDTSAPTDERTMIVGAAIVLVAAAFYWNRKRRDRIEAEQGDGDER
ncbi:MAG TPA: hypothetical protein VLX92_10615 [Kofleriaceae bacterium]|nr:hypothetical protein [Kofleriaceae bacterium]